MSWDKFVGPATIVYLASVTVAALWWASDTSARLAEVERDEIETATAVKVLQSTDGRIQRLEVLIAQLDRQMDRIESKLDRRADAR